MKSGTRINICLAAARGTLLILGLLLVTACTPSRPASNGVAPETSTDRLSSDVIDPVERPKKSYPGQFLRFENLSLEDGLSQSTIFATVQDQQGILWFGTEDGISSKIEVVPPFWSTWWFHGLILAVIIGAFYGSVKLRVRNLENRGRELEIQVKDRTDELIEVYAALRETDLERAVIEERNRLARELHDSVTQSLYSLTLFTEAARHLSEATGDEKLEGYLGQIGSLGLQALKEMRLLVFELGLHALEEDDLVEALQKRLESVEGRTGVDAKVINEGYQKQPPYVETQLFKIAQEALNNALKHAGASSVEVLFRQDKHTLEMEIIDDGIGFGPDSLNDGPGMGLKNIKNRVSRMDGKLEIESTPGKGTRIKVSIKTDDQDEKS